MENTNMRRIKIKAEDIAVRIFEDAVIFSIPVDIDCSGVQLPSIYSYNKESRELEARYPIKYLLISIGYLKKQFEFILRYVQFKKETEQTK